MPRTGRDVGEEAVTLHAHVPDGQVVHDTIVWCRSAGTQQRVEPVARSLPCRGERVRDGDLPGAWRLSEGNHCQIVFKLPYGGHRDYAYDGRVGRYWPRLLGRNLLGIGWMRHKHGGEQSEEVTYEERML
jgi:hypothetical protein